MSAADGGNRSAVDAQVLRSFVLQTPADHDSELVLDSFRDVKPVTGHEVDSTRHGRTCVSLYLRSPEGARSQLLNVSPSC